MTFAQTWDLSYGVDDDARTAATRLVSPAGPAPRLVSARQAVAASLPPEAPKCVHGAAGSAGLRQALLAIGPEAAKAARDFTKLTLREWQLDALISEAVLIASELVTNAIRHGGCAAAAEDCADAKVELAWQRQPSRVICMVTDRSPLPPLLGAADQDAESGRGLQVVQALAATWGWMMLGATSKAVWAALTVPR